MSFSVDDLVTSFNTSHIGQEAIDLAKLQAQLAQTLYGDQNTAGTKRHIPNRQRRNTLAEPCTTPMSSQTSSSSSFSSWDQMTRTNSSQRQFGTDRLGEMEDDERMVEDLLIPASPMPQSAPMSPSFQSPCMSPMHTGFYPPPTMDPSSNSPFTTTDPFYLAQVQASQMDPPTQPFFAHAGNITQGSPSPFAHHFNKQMRDSASPLTSPDTPYVLRG